MKILAIADEECASLWDFFDKSKVADIDLIISCGATYSSEGILGAIQKALAQALA